MASQSAAGRACPFCSGAVPAGAILCSTCGKFSAEAKTAVPRRRIRLIDDTNAAILRWQSGLITSPQQLAGRLKVDLPSATLIRLVVGWFLVAIALPIPLLHWASRGGFTTMWNTLAPLTVGLALLIGPRLCRPTPDAAPNAVPSSGSPAITLLGYDINLSVVQSLALATMIVAASHAYIDEAWWAAVLCTALTIPLFQSRARVSAVFIGGISGLYTLYLLAVWDHNYIYAARQYSRLFADPEWFGFYVDIPFGGIAWTAMLIATLPQVQLPRLGCCGIGKLRGDFHIRVLGSTIPVAFGSAYLLVSLYTTGWALISLPHWLPYILDMT